LNVTADFYGSGIDVRPVVHCIFTTVHVYDIVIFKVDDLFGVFDDSRGFRGHEELQSVLLLGAVGSALFEELRAGAGGPCEFRGERGGGGGRRLRGFDGLDGVGLQSKELRKKKEKGE
jgi:hypothetical protein